MTFEDERFVADETYDALTERLATMIQPCPVRGCVTTDQIKIALGECLNFWPESIRPDLIREELEARGLIAPASLH